MQWQWQYIVAFCSYLLAVVIIGVIACMVTRNLSDYVLGGRRLGGYVAALSAGASDMSSWLLMGLPGAIYLNGLTDVWVCLGLLLGAYGAWRLIALRLRIYSFLAQDSITLPAFLDNRFLDNSKQIRLVAAVITAFFFTFYIASGLYATAILLSKVFALEYKLALYISITAIILYTSLGGFLAVSWTDFFQGTFMLLALLLVPAMLYNKLPQSLALFNATNSDYFSLWHNMSYGKLLSLFSWGLGYFGMPHILVRFMSVRTVQDIKIARRVCISWMGLSLLGAVMVGILGRIYFNSPLLANEETVFLELGHKVFPPVMMGVILAAILSSCVCAIDSQMLAASSALTEDFYRTLVRPQASDKELVLVGRLTVILIAAVSFIIAQYNSTNSIMKLVAFAWAGLGAAFTPAVVASLYWARVTKNAVLASMVVGATIVIIWQVLSLNSVVYAILPATIGAGLVLLVISVVDKAPNAAILSLFATFKQRLQQGVI